MGRGQGALLPYNAWDGPSQQRILCSNTSVDSAKTEKPRSTWVTIEGTRELLSTLCMPRDRTDDQNTGSPLKSSFSSTGDRGRSPPHHVKRARIRGNENRDKRNTSPTKQRRRVRWALKDGWTFVQDTRRGQRLNRGIKHASMLGIPQAGVQDSQGGTTGGRVGGSECHGEGFLIESCRHGFKKVVNRMMS